MGFNFLVSFYQSHEYEAISVAPFILLMFFFHSTVGKPFIHRLLYAKQFDDVSIPGEMCTMYHAAKTDSISSKSYCNIETQPSPTTITVSTIQTGMTLDVESIFSMYSHNLTRYQYLFPSSHRAFEAVSTQRISRMLV